MKLYPNINKAKKILRWNSRTPLESRFKKNYQSFSVNEKNKCNCKLF